MGTVRVAVERIFVGRGHVVRRIARVVVVASEVVTTDDLGRETTVGERRRVVRRKLRGVARAAKVGVQVVDTGIDNADRGALTGSDGVPEGLGSDPRHAVDVVEVVQDDVADRHDAAQIAQAVDLVGADSNAQTVRANAKGAHLLTTERGDLFADRRLLQINAGSLGALRGWARIGTVRLHRFRIQLGDGRYVEAHENLDLVGVRPSRAWRIGSAAFATDAEATSIPAAPMRPTAFNKVLVI